MVTAPLIDPLREGVNVMPSVQLAPTASAPVQPVALKSPLADTEEIVNEVLPLFFTVTVVGALVVPTAWLGNVTLAGVNFNGAVEPPVPLPVNMASCGLKAASSVMVSTPLIVAVASGVNVTAMVHVSPAPRLAPQVVPVPPAA